MSAQPSGALARVRWGLRYGDVDWVQGDERGRVVEVVVRFDDGETAIFREDALAELVWL